MQQYADMYFLRLVQLKPVVEKVAEEAWESFEVDPTATVQPRAPE